jgi:hypothetical protein
MRNRTLQASARLRFVPACRRLGFGVERPRSNEAHWERSCKNAIPAVENLAGRSFQPRSLENNTFWDAMP